LPARTHFLLFLLCLSGAALSAGTLAYLPSPLPPRSGGHFGQALLFVADDTLAIGEPGQNAVHLFTRTLSGWIPVQTLRGAEAAGFGTALALSASGQVLAVGAPETDRGRGAVWLYFHAGQRWQPLIRLQPDDLEADNRFGAALAFQGERLLVGAPGQTVADQPGAGRVYLFRNQNGTWIETGHWQDPYPETRAGFGSALATDSRWVLVGVPGKDATLVGEQVIPANGIDAQRFAIARGDEPFCGTDAGAVYVYDAPGDDGAEPSATFAPPDAECGDRFGGHLSVSASWFAVGVPTKSVGDPFLSGSVYLYRFGETGNWQVTEILGNDDPAEGRRFGSAVQLTDDRLYIGAPGESAVRFRSGAVHRYIWREGQWRHQDLVTPPDASANAHWGERLAATPGGLLAFGAPQRRTGIADQGGMAAVTASDEQLMPTGYYQASSGSLRLDAVIAPNGQTYAATLQQTGPGVFQVEQAEPVEQSTGQTGYFGTDGRLWLPWIEVRFTDGHRQRYRALLRQAGASPLQFRIEAVYP